MATGKNKNYFFTSLIFHAAVLLILIIGFNFSAPLPVIENTHKNDVISAVILGDTEKSKILPQQPAPKPVVPEIKPEPKPKEEPKPQITPKQIVKSKPVIQPEIKKDVVALKVQEEKKKLAEQKAAEEKKQRDLFAKNLLADIKKQTEKKKQAQQKQLKSQFEKMLHQQAEKSLRQQLINEDIKLKGSQARQASGEVNKYKALIIQSISEHWLVPPQANKKLYCELMIRVAPGGAVLDVKITKSSGDPSLDSSARAAVLKASPLPVPSKAAAFDAFRQFVLKVRPENILASE